ncbi:MAG: YigZ family protein [Bacteroidales bacterium]
MIEDSYKSISAPSEGLYKEKGSKFLAFVFPVESEDQIKTHRDELRKTHFDARHHCFAFRLGIKGDRYRMNDDGEPSFTGGKPIYGQILSNELSDILIVVVRYFGGTKLGVPGLTRAYKSAAANALENAEIIEKIIKEDVRIKYSYDNTSIVMHTISDFNLTPEEQTFEEDCRMLVKVRLKDLEKFKEEIVKSTEIIK